jgi:hypothetical protein
LNKLIHLRVLIGDYNKDGYPDILLVSEGKGWSPKSHFRLLQSIPCTKKICTKDQMVQGSRTFSAVTNGVAELDTNNNKKIRAAFFDLLEDVRAAVCFRKFIIMVLIDFLRERWIYWRCQALGTPKRRLLLSIITSLMMLSSLNHWVSAFTYDAEKMADNSGLVLNGACLDKCVIPNSSGVANVRE